MASEVGKTQLGKSEDFLFIFFQLTCDANTWRTKANNWVDGKKLLPSSWIV